MSGSLSPYLWEAASRFLPAAQIQELTPYGQGNVHQTYLLRARPPAADLLLQRLNPTAFPQPWQVLANLKIVSAHLEARLRELRLPRRWELVRLQPTRDGRDWWLDPAGGYWRALNFIAATRTLELVSTLEQAREVGWGLGLFHRLIVDLPVQRLADPLPEFHVTPLYLQEYDRQVANAEPVPPELQWIREFIQARRGRAGVLEEAKAAGRLSLRPIHGDPKVNNFLWEAEQDLVVALVDLDTVKPGLRLYDLGDCLRSAANPAGEETAAWEQVYFDLSLARAILQGYVVHSPLEPAERALLPAAVWLIAFELGLRFFTDYLAGNRYFRVQDPEQNLRRALVQLQLAASIEAQWPALDDMIRALR